MTGTTAMALARRRGLVAATVDLLLAVALAILLSVITNAPADAVSRPLGLAVLFAAPGVIGGLGAVGGRRSLLVAAIPPLVVGSFLSWAFVTLPFVVPALLFARAAGSMPADPRRFGARLPALLVAALAVALVLAAGATFLFASTRDTCGTSDGLSFCSSAATTLEGGAIALALIIGAVAVAAAWAATDRVRAPSGAPRGA